MPIGVKPRRRDMTTRHRCRHERGIVTGIDGSIGTGTGTGAGAGATTAAATKPSRSRTAADLPSYF
ncbi:MAG TPA: hypothetical protein VM847_07385 [Tahibacter sp.]|nr:hypothetical protein [Tahibacter sp.]